MLVSDLLDEADECELRDSCFIVALNFLFKLAC
jgi:hypothetical protein